MTLYDVHIESVDRGWTLDATHGVRPAPTDRAVLTDRLSYTWGFEGGNYPGPLDPAKCSFAYACRAHTDDPSPEEGELVKITIWPGSRDDGNPVVHLYGRVTEATAELIPEHRRWPIRGQVTVADLLAELSQRFPRVSDTAGSTLQPGTRPRRALASLATVLGLRVGVPTSWYTQDVGSGVGDDAGTIPAQICYVIDGDDSRPDWDDSARTELAKLTHSLSHENAVFTALPWYCDAATNRFPSGQREAKGAPPYFTPWPTPDSRQYYLMVPASRNDSGGLWPPYVLRESTAGLRPEIAYISGTRIAAVDAAYCDSPSSARRGLEGAPTAIVNEGYTVYNEPGSNVYRFRQGGTRTSSSDAAAARSVRSRTVQSRLAVTVDTTNLSAISGQPMADAVARQIMPDDSTYTEGYTWDAVAIRMSRVPVTRRRDILRNLLPAEPTYSPGAQALAMTKFMVLYGLPEAIQLTGRDSIRGFVTGARLTIARGELTVEPTTAPGVLNPHERVHGVLSPSQMAEDIMPGDFDPTVTAIDMRLVRNG